MSDNAESDAMAAEILAVQMGWVKPEDCTYKSSPSIAGMEKTVKTETDDNGVEYNVVVWSHKK